MTLAVTWYHVTKFRKAGVSSRTHQRLTSWRTAQIHMSLNTIEREGYMHITAKQA